MTIYEKLGFTEKEVAYMLDHIRDVLSKGDIQVDKANLKKHFKKLDKLVQQMDYIITADVPTFYQRRHRNVISALKVARQIVAENALVSLDYEGERLPKKKVQSLNRTATFLKGQYERKTGKPISLNKEFRSAEDGVDGGFVELLEQVVDDVGQAWIRTLVSRARDLYETQDKGQK